MSKIVLHEIEKVNNIEGWKTVKTMAEQESVTVQDLYYRVKIGRYKAINLGGIILVRSKDVRRLRRREGQVQNEG